MKALLVPLLVFSFTPLAAGFSDVPEYHPNAEAITYAEEEGIIQGYADGTFHPDEAINRVEFLKVLMLSTDLTTRPCTKMFFNYSDTDPNAWYNSYLQTAGNCGIAKGYSDGSFRPEQSINFAEATKVLLETKERAMCDTLTVSTYPTNAPWYTPYFICMDEYNARPRTDIVAGDFITRGEMAEMIYALSKISTEPMSEEIIMKVGAEKKECVGVGPMMCLEVNGQLFYSNIEGFEHQDGYEYTLLVEKTERAEPLPADASKYTYRLIEITSMKPTGEAFVGLTEDEAFELADEHEDVFFRVVQRDGEFLPVTMDYRPGRINATVENDLVVSYTIE